MAIQWPQLKSQVQTRVSWTSISTSGCTAQLNDSKSDQKSVGGVFQKRGAGGPGGRFDLTKGSSSIVVATPTYGWFYLFAPALIVFTIGLSINQTFWKVVVGCCTRDVPCRCFRSWRGFLLLNKTIAIALIAPFAWVNFGLLRGDFYACAVTQQPYKLTDGNSCDDVSALKKTDEYKENAAASQIMGWCLLTCVSFLIWLFYLTIRCSSRTNYYQQRYISSIKNWEEQVFYQAMNELCKDESVTLAKKFLKSKPKKEVWNEILDVLLFKDDVDHLKLNKLYEKWQSKQSSQSNTTSV
ncbi:calcium homeostasis modulator protein 6-like isoform X2 [Clavelina lepadiformis]|uniref:calcium homeostasis modulator protein 6-like isoform X2 n=1 Tax=Clavelina lepadiformis TaxID=159417 RepID=UPI0040417F1C